MRNKSSYWLLAIALCGCGRVHHEVPSTPGGGSGSGSAGTGGSADTGGSGGDPATTAGAGGEAGAPVVSNCLYPHAGPSLEISSNAGPVALQLSAPFHIAAPLGTWQGLSAAYDVNGDLTSDLLYYDAQAQPPRFRLLVTSPPPNVFALHELDCSALASLPGGRLVLRDLNADNVPDFVISVERGVQAFLNLPGGVQQVLDYTFASDGVNSLLNAGVTDLNADQRADLVLGYDRINGADVGAYQLGVWSFLQQPDGSFQPGEAMVTLHAAGGGVGAESPWLVGGYFAAGRFGSDAQGSVVMTGTNALFSSVPLGITSQFDGQPPGVLHAPVTTPAVEVFALPKGDGHDYLLSVSVKTLDVIDLSQDLPRAVSSQPLAFGGGISHELGGGAELPRYYLYDIDGDLDLDFFERDATSAQFALHLNLGQGVFDVPQSFGVQLEYQAESPFVRIGPGGGVVGQPNPGQLGSAVYSLFPRSLGAK